MRMLMLSVGVLAIVVTSVGVAAEKKTKSRTATGSLEVSPYGLDGQLLKKNSVLLWQKIESGAANKDLWQDTKTDTWWKQVNGCATSGTSTFDELESGTYRVTAREGHGQSGPFGVGEPVVIDDIHQKVSSSVPLIPGGTLQLTCVDATTGRAVPPPYISLQLVESDLWQGIQFTAEPVVGQPGHFEFRNLPAGKYRLNASRSAANPDDVKYDLAGGEIEMKIDPRQNVSRELKFKKSKPTPDDIARAWPWVVYGKITDKKGRPVADAVVRAHAGYGTLRQTGGAVSDTDGRYRLYFHEGIQIDDGGYNLQVAIISASKPGMDETNLNQQGEIAIAYKQPSEMDGWLKNRPLVLPKEPREINFTLVPLGKLGVRIFHSDQRETTGVSVSLKGKTMPPGSSVIDSGHLNKWGEVIFAEVPLDKEWWIELETKDRRSVRTQPFRLTDPQRYDLVLDWRTDSTGIEVLDITSLSDSLGRDQTLTLVGDDPQSHGPASAADQKQVHEWLRKLADANRLWLSPPPEAVSEYRYDFHLADNPARRYEVPKNRGVAGVVYHGIAYVASLRCLTDKPDNVVARRIDRSDGSVSISYTLREPASISAGNGVLNTYRGFFSTALRGGTLVFDPRTFQVQQHEAGDVVEKYSDYLTVGDGRVVPRTVEVSSGGAMRFRWSFAMYEPGLWLLDRSLASDTDEKDGFVRIDNVVINGAPPVPWRAK